MTNLKGMLDVRADGSYRLTKGQMGWLATLVAMTGTPDRSCVTCVHESGDFHCGVYDQKIPNVECIDAGCDQWSDDE